MTLRNKLTIALCGSGRIGRVHAEAGDFDSAAITLRGLNGELGSIEGAGQ